MTKLQYLIVLVICLFAAPATAAPNLSASDKAALQATMHKEIDRQLIAGKYLDFDLDTQKISTLYPAKTHPMILAMDDHFILCTDFRDSAGKSVNVDFYVARNDDSFVVFKTVIDERDVIKKLMKAGRVTVLK